MKEAIVEPGAGDGEEPGAIADVPTPLDGCCAAPDRDRSAAAAAAEESGMFSLN